MNYYWLWTASQEVQETRVNRAVRGAREGRAIDRARGAEYLHDSLVLVLE